MTKAIMKPASMPDGVKFQRITYISDESMGRTVGDVVDFDYDPRLGGADDPLNPDQPNPDFFDHWAVDQKYIDDGFDVEVQVLYQDKNLPNTFILDYLTEPHEQLIGDSPVVRFRFNDESYIDVNINERGRLQLRGQSPNLGTMCVYPQVSNTIELKVGE